MYAILFLMVGPTVIQPDPDKRGYYYPAWVGPTPTLALLYMFCRGGRKDTDHHMDMGSRSFARIIVSTVALLLVWGTFVITKDILISEGVLPR